VNGKWLRPSEARIALPIQRLIGQRPSDGIAMNPDDSCRAINRSVVDLIQLQTIWLIVIAIMMSFPKG
jgi:hypothetical protein